jgi:hypothetical protein
MVAGPMPEEPEHTFEAEVEEDDEESFEIEVEEDDEESFEIEVEEDVDFEIDEEEDVDFEAALQEAPASAPSAAAPKKPSRSAPVEGGPSATGIAHIGAFFTHLDKVVRATRLYQGRGALVDRLVGETMEKAEPALRGGEFTVRVTPFGLLLGDVQVAPSKSRLTEVLFTLFCDGIRELTFSPGLGEDDVRDLVGVLISDPAQGEDDFSTLLWKKELTHIHFYATDTLQTDVEMPTEGEQGLLAAAERSHLQSAGAGGQEFVLSPDDLRMLKTGDGLSWVRECAAPMTVGQVNETTVQSVRDAFETPFDCIRFLQMAVRAAEDHPREPSPLVLDLFDSVVAGRDAPAAANLLKAAAEAARSGGLAAKSLYDGLLDDKRIVRLAPLYAQHPDVLGPPLRDSAATSPKALVGLLNKLSEGEARDQLLSALVDAGVDLTSYYSRCLSHENEEIVAHAIGALAKFDTDAARTGIASALGYTSTRIRRLALECLVGHYPEEARLSLARAMSDPDRDNRLLALKVLRESGDRRAAGNILGRIESSAFSSRDEDEQQEFIRALSRFKDPRTVPYFAGVLAVGGLVRSKAVARQLLAVEALAGIPGDDARDALVRSSKKWGLARDVKQAAKRALGGG